MNISFFPAVAWTARLSRRGDISGAELTAGRVISGATPDGGAATSRTARARFFFLRLRNAVAARVLTGTELNDSCLTTRQVGDVTGLVQLPPKPAQFFLCPRRNHSGNSRGLRLVWLMGINGQVS